VPIPEDDFQTIDGDGDGQPMLDLSPDTTQGKLFRFLLEHADQAFRQREIITSIDVPRGSVGPTLSRLEQRGLVEHRDRFWAVADAEHAVATAGLHGAATADEVDGGFSDEDVATWMETAADPIETNTEGANDEEA
jgi:DNA-binding transcriptional MocR family regulator